MKTTVRLKHRCVGARLVDPSQVLAPLLAAAKAAPLTPAPSAVHSPDPSAALTEALQAMAYQLADQRDRQWQLVHQLQEASVEIAMAVVSRIWREHQSTLPVRPMVESLVAAVRPHTPAILRLHPQQWATWQQIPDHTLPPELEAMTVVADPQLAPGTCRLEADQWTIESSVTSLLAELRQQLLEELADARLEMEPAESMYRPMPGHAHHRPPA
jgi:flagellar biosynthesis/type III secretory pathway protein FliH